MFTEDGKNTEMIKKFNALIIGCGKIAGIYDDPRDNIIYSHAKAYNRNNYFSSVSYCDLEISKSKKLASLYGSELYGCDFQKMINKFKPDVISVCTETVSHYKIISEILNHDFLPKIIFLEKPVCDNLTQYNTLIQLSEKKGVKIVVNHSRRFDSNLNSLKKLISDNFFGKLIQANITYYGGWKNNGTHVLDTILFLFGKQIKLVKTGKVENSRHLNDPTLDMHFTFMDNSASFFINGFNEKFYQLFDFDFKFDKSRLRIEAFGNLIIYEKKAKNNMNENILIKSDLNLIKNSSFPIENAMLVLSKFLSGDKDIINGYTIEDVFSTMKLILPSE